MIWAWVDGGVFVPQLNAYLCLMMRRKYALSRLIPHG